jgi:hypothetical protein
MIPHFKQSVTVIPGRQLHFVVPYPGHYRQDQMCWLSGNFSSDLSSALRGHYAELKI